MAELMPTARTVSLALTGSGGVGVITAGNLLLSAAAKSGWYGLFGRSAGPQIRGGEAAALVRLSSQPVETHDDLFDVLIALDWQNFERFAGELPLGAESLVIADPDQGAVPESVVASGATVLEVPVKALAKAIKKGRQNMVALGAVAALIGLPEERLFEVVEEQLASKGEEARRASIEALVAGRRAAEGLGLERRLERPDGALRARWSVSGNQAAGLGAIRGGVRFVAGYPITPATEMLEWMAPNLIKVGGALVQAEDELASINMIIGASYGGTPALTATSGPGLALMTESIGLAVAAEVPIVVVDVMRGGPSTGIPTKSEQSDLNIALFGLHGDAPHLVSAPTSIADCLFTTQWTVHLAESMQVPAILLSDQMMAQSRAIIDRPADLAFVAGRVTAEREMEGYRRYAIGADRTSPMAIPGTPGGQYTAMGSSTPKPACLRAKRLITCPSSTSDETRLLASITAITGRRSRARASWLSLPGARRPAPCARQYPGSKGKACRSGWSRSGSFRLYRSAVWPLRSTESSGRWWWSRATRRSSFTTSKATASCPADCKAITVPDRALCDPASWPRRSSDGTGHDHW